MRKNYVKSLIQKAVYENSEGYQQEEMVFQKDFASEEPKKRLTAMLEKRKKD